MIDVRFVQYVLFAVLFPFIIGLMGPHLRSYPTFGQRVFRILEGVLHVSLDETTKKLIENETHQYCITREKF